jgi:hypothetical protein
MRRPERKATTSRRRHSSPQRRHPQLRVRIVISIERGIADVIDHTGAPCEVVLRDYDTDGADDERLSTKTRLRPCDGCGTPTHIDLLDGKDDGTGNFTILECRKCYGPGWAPFLARQVRYHYECPDCGYRWHDIWSAQADDADCPECGKRHISPTHSEDVP